MSFVASDLAELLPRVSSLMTKLAETSVRAGDRAGEGSNDAAHAAAQAIRRDVASFVRDMREQSASITTGEVSLSDTQLLERGIEVLKKAQGLLVRQIEAARLPKTAEVLRSAAEGIQEARWTLSAALAKQLPIDADRRVLSTAQEVRDWVANIDQAN